jgi:hypothetical protein
MDFPFIFKSIVGVACSLAFVPVFFRALKRPFDCFVSSDGLGSKLETFVSLFQINLLGIFLSYFVGNPIIQFAPGEYLKQITFILLVLVIIGSLRLININYPKYQSHDLVVWSYCGSAILIFTVIVYPDYLQDAIKKAVFPENTVFQWMTMFALMGSSLVAVFIEWLGVTMKKLNARDEVTIAQTKKTDRKSAK